MTTEQSEAVQVRPQNLPLPVDYCHPEDHQEFA